MKIANFALELLAYLSFIWAALRFFRKTKSDNRQLGIVLISAVGLFNIFLSLYLTYYKKSDSTVESVLVSILLVISICLFWAAIYANRHSRLAFAFSELNSEEIVTVGPYKLIRHPFYVSYSLAWLAAIICTHSVIITIFSLILVGTYIRAAYLEEELLSSGPTAADYTCYISKTGRFLPKLFNRRKL